MKQSDIYRLALDEREIIIVGTAHVSKESADLVEQVIENEKPDTVCVELCQSRYDAIKQKTKWHETDIFRIVREKRTALLLSQLLMASFQKKLAEKFNINPGEEMLRAIAKAEETGAEITLADRDIRTTLLRTWRSMKFKSKVKLLFEIPFSLFSSDDIDEEEIENLKKHDALELALRTFGNKLPEVKKSLIDERDQYLSHMIAHASGKKIVAIVGAGHVPGIISNINKEIDLSAISTIPPKGKVGKTITWVLALFVVGIIVAGFFHSGSNTGIDMLKWWILANSILAGIGALIVFAHPITVVASIVAAPLTSLNPMVAAGWVAGLTEASLRKPQVKDFIDLRNDIASVRGFWHNKVTRILLVVIFVNLGSSIGTFVAIPLMMRLL